MSRPLIYLASPYTHKHARVMEHRAEMAAQATAALKRQGWHVISPIAHGHAVAKYGTPIESSWWRDYNFNVLARCDGMLVLTIDGWQTSLGVNDEIACCDEIPIRHELITLDRAISNTPLFAEYAHLWEIKQ